MILGVVILSNKIFTNEEVEILSKNIYLKRVSNK